MERATVLDPDEAENHSEYGHVLEDLGRLRDASVHFRRAMKLQPNCTYRRSEYGRVLKDLIRLRDAAVHSKRVKKLEKSLKVEAGKIVTKTDTSENHSGAQHSEPEEKMGCADCGVQKPKRGYNGFPTRNGA